MTEFCRLPASDVGLKAPRGCTNICGLFLFVIFWALMAFVGVKSYQLGDLKRLQYGVDYMGNVCGQGNPSLTNLPPNTAWSSMTLLWYPITIDASGQVMLTSARQMGVCVAECPGQYQSVPVYYAPGGVSPVPTWNAYFSLFTSSAQLNRCVPNLKTFCQLAGGCTANNTNLATASISDFYDALQNGFNDLQAGWWVLLSCCAIAIVVSFVWMFVLRRIVKPMVVLTMVVLVVVLAAGGYLLFRMANQNSGTDTHNYYLAAAIAAWVLDFLIVCVILFVRKDVMIACDIIEEASKIPISLPSMMLVPPIFAVLLLPFAFFFLFTSASIYTAASTINATLPIPQIDPNQYNGTYHTLTPINFQSKQYSFENWRVFAEIYNLLMFLWSVGFVNAIAFMITAFCGVFWYWSAPGDDKKPEAGPCVAFSLTVKNHLGTLAIGSFVVAVLQVARVILALLEKRLEALAGKSDAIRCCVYCAECLLACFTRVVKFINKNAYIVTTMTGEPFLTAAKHAMELLLQNALSVAAISVIGEWVCLFGKVLITGVVLVICYFMSGGSDSDKNVVLLMIVVGLATYFITCVFINVFHVCIDTVLLCYCYDLREHDGQAKPYYFPSDLAKHVQRARDRMATTQQQEQQAIAKPLKEAA